MKKTCAICKKQKPRTEFNKSSSRKDGLQTKCRKCSKLKSKLHYTNNKSYYKQKSKRRKNAVKRSLKEYKETLSCNICGENESCCLDFHHKDPKDKSFSIGESYQHYSWEKICAEIDKCVVVCSNCHRKIHAGLITA